jgi:non-reducing end alpha-L-arabinofuranosidase
VAAAAGALAAGAMAAAGVTVGVTSAAAATQEPCDIYAAAGTPCVAAHSTTRALYAAYDGALYQVRRASDNTTTNIYPLSAGGAANAATQNSFCSGTTGVITEIYDQSGNRNNLTDAPAGGPDGLANATAAPTTVEGQPVYGVYIAAGDGYRDDSTKDIATGNNSEREYDVVDGTHYDAGCCFDYGNAETGSGFPSWAYAGVCGRGFPSVADAGVRGPGAPAQRDRLAEAVSGLDWRGEASRRGSDDHGHRCQGFSAG